MTTRLRLLAFGAAALIVAIIGFVLDPRRAAATYLVAYAGTVSVALGVLSMVMIANLTRAVWFDAWRDRAYRVLSAFPTLAALGIPVLLSMAVLYDWVSTPPGGHVSVYLNVPFFIGRFIAYWAVWIVLALTIRRGTLIRADEDAGRVGLRYRRISAGGLVVLGLTMTFAAIDWMMSLSPDMSSTIYGVYWFAGSMVAALALLGTVVRREPAQVHSLAKLLLTFVLFWLYIGFAQYIVIWSADLPREVGWYTLRTRGGWGGVALALIVGNFAFPFLILLLRDVKRSPTLIAALGAVLLGLHYLDTLWIVMPGLVPMTWWTLILVISMSALLFGSTVVAR